MIHISKHSLIFGIKYGIIFKSKAFGKNRIKNIIQYRQQKSKTDFSEILL